MSALHESVLLEEVVGSLLPTGRHIQRIVDGTLGAGGHSAALLARSAADLLGLDLDPQALALARERLAPFGPRAHLVQASYATMQQRAAALGWSQVDAILLDLGVSSMQLDTPERGFAFRLDGPLDMRFVADGRPSAADLVNQWEADALAEVFWRYGEERYSRSIARAIVQARPIYTTAQLAELVTRVIPRERRTQARPIHPATRVFQALRMAVNDELSVLEAALPQAIDLLASGGRLAVISFHSLEDALVKRVLREASESFEPPPGMASLERKVARLRLLTRKPIEAQPAEAEANPRARSAKLRLAEKL
ncbi:MAG: 16S rRNA (cytosine(1402)-N(4))-methyltransferase RsmH [Anaerolineae bacterium]|nr:16S rRNA (cytosine(1402)-N(4))-methyltransferase RsmH [Anaerolineae bacterium]MDW8173505.1 16S rRNA (cytosine(1402)-N(4))-methyltransferase RsmH [Anaerolineae bacterium]